MKGWIEMDISWLLCDSAHVPLIFTIPSFRFQPPSPPTGLQTKINQLQTESNTYQKARQNAEVRAQQLQIELNTIHNKIGTELVTRLVFCCHGNIMVTPW